MSVSYDNEDWREIKDTEGMYFVSNRGRVLSLARNVPIIMKPNIRKSYIQYKIKVNGEFKQKSIHHLVGEAFIENPEHKPIVHHKDTNPLNNNVDNL